MKTHRLLFLTTTLALSLLATDTASAWRRPLVIARPTPKPKKVDASTQLTIVKVAGNSISVKGSTTTQAYKIDGHTLININGRKGSVGDLKAGMNVELEASRIDPTLALSITATTVGAR